MSRIKILVVFFCTMLLLSCKSHKLDIDEFAKEYDSLGVKFFNEEYFVRCRKLVFESIKPDYIGGDTIVLIENFTNCFLRYSCYFYMSEEIPNYKTYYAKDDFGKNEFAISLVSSNLSEMSTPFLRAIKNNCLNEAIEKAKKQIYTPHSTVVITIAIKEEDDYVITCYLTSTYNEVYEGWIEFT